MWLDICFSGYLITMSTEDVIWYQLLNDRMIMNGEMGWCGKKQSYSVWRYSTSIYLEGLRNSVGRAGLMSKFKTMDILDMKWKLQQIHNDIQNIVPQYYQPIHFDAWPQP